MKKGSNDLWMSLKTQGYIWPYESHDVIWT